MIGCHCHTAKGSNIRLIDCTNHTDQLIETAAAYGYKGLAITDHEALCSHVEAIKATRELKEDGKIPQDFKLILGNEIYLLLGDDTVEETKESYKGGVTKFPHFILLAKDEIGHRQLRILSSEAWNNSFYTGIMERTPTEKAFLEKVVGENKGHLIATTACLGSEINIYLMSLKEAEESNNIELQKELKQKIDTFVKWCINIFGKENFFVEIQPALSDEQIYCNKKLIPIAKHYGLKWIVTTDVHFLRPEDREIHKAFLNSKEGDREVDNFYEACFLQTYEEMHERMSYLGKEVVETAIQNTLLIGDMIRDFDLAHSPIIPKIELPSFEVRHIFKPVYSQFEYISKVANSENEQDRYTMKLIEDGFDEYLRVPNLSKDDFYKILSRINDELGELWEISNKLNQSMTSYYITIREIINIIWDDECGNSLVGSARGSAAGFLVNFLLGITQVNPLAYDIELPHWRHIHKSRPDIPDIDIDTEGSKRKQILRALRDRFGESRMLSICTFGTEGSKSALQTACRGLGIDSDISLFLSGMIPFERGQNWSLKDCFDGNPKKERKPVKELINEIEKYPHLKETALKIEGLTNKRSVHAAGVYIFNDNFYETNAMMKAPNGQHVTQFDMKDSEYMGNTKFDLLTIEGLDKIRATLEYLTEAEEIEWQGNLRDTFNKYLHPQNLEFDSPEMWKMIAKGEILDLFQFSTDIGLQSAIKVKPKNLLETAVTNSLMRLMSDGEEQPVDTYIKYKNDISLWYKEMEQHGLNEEEVKVMEYHLLKLYGVADTQESVMQMSMDEKISSFTVEEANKLRKTIAK